MPIKVAPESTHLDLILCSSDLYFQPCERYFYQYPLLSFLFKCHQWLLTKNFCFFILLFLMYITCNKSPSFFIVTYHLIFLITVRNHHTNKHIKISYIFKDTKRAQQCIKPWHLTLKFKDHESNYLFKHKIIHT